MAATILVVEDDSAVALALEVALRGEGYLPVLAGSGDEGLKIGLAEAPDLLILDVRLPGIDGFELLRRLRAGGSKAPVIILTARDEEVDTILGLELGADDYMTKPFRVRELLTRVKSQLRRAYGELADAGGGRVIRADDLLIDLERRRVSRGGKRIALTPTEFEILRILAEKPGRVFARRDLLERVRDYDAALAGDEKTINVHVSHLRDKIEEDPSAPRFVLTVRGVGYSFADAAERGAAERGSNA
ncbi:MAG: DNA-binding response regulator [Chloroflexi bacterium]|jgi:DNA-binding response OmpR family regulator|nr:MAG: DNA-binding response regulator [Chloroflexota bacterium]RLT29993.1 MAG: DNA-binding response regulator [Chloroflexota bacterium]